MCNPQQSSGDRHRHEGSGIQDGTAMRMPAYERVATPWAADACPSCWGQVENPLPGMQPASSPLQIPQLAAMAGSQGGVEYTYQKQPPAPQYAFAAPQAAPFVNAPEYVTFGQPVYSQPAFAESVYDPTFVR